MSKLKNFLLFLKGTYIKSFFFFIFFFELSYTQESKFTVETNFLYSMPKGRFHQKYIFDGNAAAGFGCNARLNYRIIPKISVGLQSGLHYFGTNYKDNLPLTYQFIPINLCTKVILYEGYPSLYFYRWRNILGDNKF